MGLVGASEISDVLDDAMTDLSSISDAKRKLLELWQAGLVRFHTAQWPKFGIDGCQLIPETIVITVLEDADSWLPVAAKQSLTMILFDTTDDGEKALQQFRK